MTFINTQESMLVVAEKCRTYNHLNIIFKSRTPNHVCVLGQDIYSKFALLIRAYLGPACFGESYNLLANGMSTCPAANCH